MNPETNTHCPPPRPSGVRLLKTTSADAKPSALARAMAAVDPSRRQWLEDVVVAAARGERRAITAMSSAIGPDLLDITRETVRRSQPRFAADAAHQLLARLFYRLADKTYKGDEPESDEALEWLEEELRKVAGEAYRPRREWGRRAHALVVYEDCPESEGLWPRYDTEGERHDDA
jgi:hypothetical protein